jgi:hypothetical protein
MMTNLFPPSGPPALEKITPELWYFGGLRNYRRQLCQSRANVHDNNLIRMPFVVGSVTPTMASLSEIPIKTVAQNWMALWQALTAFCSS